MAIGFSIGASPLLSALQPARFQELYGRMQHPASGIRRSPRLDSPEAVYARTQGAYDAMRAVDPRVEQAYSAFEKMLGGVPESTLGDPRIQRYADYNKGLAARGVSPEVLAANARRVATGVDPDTLDYHTELLNQLGGRIHAYYGEGPPRVFESQLEHGRPSMVDITPPTLQAKDILGGQLAREQMRSQERIEQSRSRGDIPSALNQMLTEQQVSAMQSTSDAPIDEQGNLLNIPQYIAKTEQARNTRRVAIELAKQYGRPTEPLGTPEDVDADSLQVLLASKKLREEAFELLDQGNPKVAEWLKRLASFPGGEELAEHRKKYILRPRFWKTAGESSRNVRQLVRPFDIVEK